MCQSFVYQTVTHSVCTKQPRADDPQVARVVIPDCSLPDFLHTRVHPHKQCTLISIIMITELSSYLLYSCILLPSRPQTLYLALLPHSPISPPLPLSLFGSLPTKPTFTSEARRPGLMRLALGSRKFREKEKKMIVEIQNICR